MNKVAGRELPRVNAHISERLSAYPEDVCEVARQAVALAESYSESTVVEMLDTTIRRVAKKRRGDAQ